MDTTFEEIRGILRNRPDLRKDEYAPDEDETVHPLYGHCYVATEAYYHAKKDDYDELSVYHVSHAGTTHWFLKDSQGNIIDLTKEQFDTEPNYSEATKGFFLSSEPSNRTQEILNELSKY